MLCAGLAYHAQDFSACWCSVRICGSPVQSLARRGVADMSIEVLLIVHQCIARQSSPQASVCSPGCCSCHCIYVVHLGDAACRAWMSTSLQLPRRRHLPRSRQPSPPRSEVVLYHSLCFVLLCSCLISHLPAMRFAVTYWLHSFYLCLAAALRLLTVHTCITRGCFGVLQAAYGCKPEDRFLTLARYQSGHMLGSVQ